MIFRLYIIALYIRASVEKKLKLKAGVLTRLQPTHLWQNFSCFSAKPCRLRNGNAHRFLAYARKLR